jgi:hypothetical protein
MRKRRKARSKTYIRINFIALNDVFLQMMYSICEVFVEDSLSADDDAEGSAKTADGPGLVAMCKIFETERGFL